MQDFSVRMFQWLDCFIKAKCFKHVRHIGLIYEITWLFYSQAFSFEHNHLHLTINNPVHVNNNVPLIDEEEILSFHMCPIFKCDPCPTQNCTLACQNAESVQCCIMEWISTEGTNCGSGYCETPLVYHHLVSLHAQLIRNVILVFSAHHNQVVAQTIFNEHLAKHLIFSKEIALFPLACQQAVKSACLHCIVRCHCHRRWDHLQKRTGPCFHPATSTRKLLSSRVRIDHAMNMVSNGIQTERLVSFVAKRTSLKQAHV